ncbi:MAG: tetratricopeptide repeat protein [Myxococcota bacterium]|nr:tetratricopeptide repeat protein [Myxococcota bacterium]
MSTKKRPLDPDALHNLETFLSTDPENLGALKALADAYEASESWERLTEIIKRIIATSQLESVELKGYYTTLGTIYTDKLQQPQEAIQAFSYASQVDLMDLVPLRALEKIYAAQGMWEELADVLGRKAELLPESGMIETLLQQAKVYEDVLSEPHRAKSAYTRILNTAPLHDLAFERMVDIESGQRHWDEVAELYLNRLAYVVEKEARIRIFYVLARIYEEHLRQPDKAFIVLQTAFEEDSSNDTTLGHLERLASIAGKWDELLASANQALQATQDQRIKNELCLKIGQWYADELCCPEYAIQYYQQVLVVHPFHLGALKLIGELYRSTRQWDELAAVLERAVKRETDPEQQKLFHLELACLYEDHLQNAGAARSAYTAALKLDPGLKEALVALERLLGGERNWAELIPVLRNRLENLGRDPGGRVALHLRIAEIFEEHLDDPKSAIDEYRRVLEVEQGNLLALKGLGRLYNKVERWQDLLDVLLLELAHAASEREQIQLLERIAQMQEQEFVKPDKAADHYEQILEIEPANEKALAALERLYRQLSRWHALVTTLERRVMAVSDRTARIGCYLQMGEIFAAELGQADRAMDMYKKILDIDKKHHAALDQLAQLQSQKGDWAGAKETLARLAKLAASPQQKVDLLYRLGRLSADNLKNSAAAEEHFRSALDVEPGHLPALAALQQIYMDDGQWVPAYRVLEAQQTHTQNPRQRSKLQLALGALCAKKLRDDAQALMWYEQALISDPDNQQAADILVDLYMRDERWREAEALLDRLVLSGEKSPVAQMQSNHRKYAAVAEKLGNLPKALKGYQAAFSLDTSHLQTAFNLADAYFRLEQWDDAQTLFEWMLSQPLVEQNPAALVEVYTRLGVIEVRLDNARQAQKMFEKVLKIDSKNRPALTAIIELNEQRTNWKKVISYKLMLADAVNAWEKGSLLAEIGDLTKEQMDDPRKAISYYVAALGFNPRDRAVLSKLLALYQQTKQWQRVIEVIGEITSLETDDDNLAILTYSMGVVFRDELRSPEEAVEQFDLCLDYNPTNLKAFEAMDRILTERKDWKRLERSYRKMLYRLTGKGQTELEVHLWHSLGEIYRTRLGRAEPAAAAFKMAATLDPDNRARHEILVELYSSMPDSVDKAVAEYQGLIRQNPRDAEYYKRLCKLYMDSRQFDKAWCLCATLVYFKKASDKERRFYEEHRKRGQGRAQARLDNEHWLQDLFHPDESVYAGKIFEAVLRVVRNLRAQPIKAFDLGKNMSPKRPDKLGLTEGFFYAAQVLNLPVVPALYIQKQKPGGLSFVITDPIATVCGSTLLAGYSHQDLLFLAGKHLSYYRPEHYIRWVLPAHRDLKLLFLAAMKVGAPNMKLPKDKSGALEQYVGVLQQQLESMEVQALGKVIRRFVKAGQTMDIKKWVRAIELTSCRAGFLLVSDLAVAAQMVQNEADPIKEITAQEKIKELLLFSVSEEYFRLRIALEKTISS